MKVLNTMNCVRIVAASLLLLMVNASQHECMPLRSTEGLSLIPQKNAPRSSITWSELKKKGKIGKEIVNTLKKQFGSEKKWNNLPRSTQDVMVQMHRNSVCAQSIRRATVEQRRQSRRMTEKTTELRVQAQTKKPKSDGDEKKQLSCADVSKYFIENADKSTPICLKDIIANINSIKGQLGQFKKIFTYIVVTKVSKEITQDLKKHLSEVSTLPEFEFNGVRKTAEVCADVVRGCITLLSKVDASGSDLVGVAKNMLLFIRRMDTVTTQMESFLKSLQLSVSGDVEGSLDTVGDVGRSVLSKLGNYITKAAKNLWKDTKQSLLNVVLNNLDRGLVDVKGSIDNILKKLDDYNKSAKSGAAKGIVEGLGFDTDTAERVGLVVENVSKIARIGNAVKDFFTNYGQKIIEWIKKRTSKEGERQPLLAVA